MKRKIYAPLTALGLVAIAASALLLGSGTPVGAANLSNGDFATDINGWTLNGGDFGGFGAAVPNWDNGFGNPAGSLNFQDVTFNPGDPDTFTVDSDCVPSLAPGSYDFSGDFFGEASNDGTVKVQLVVYNSTNCTLGTDAPAVDSSVSPSNIAGWTSVSQTGVIVAPNQSAVVKLWFNTPGGGLPSNSGNWDNILLTNAIPATDTPTATATNTATPTDTATPTSTATDTPTPTATSTPTDTPTVTNTPTDTATATDTATPAPTNTATDTPTATSTAAATDTPTATSTAAATDTPTATNTAAATNTPTSTTTPATSTPGAGNTPIVVPATSTPAHTATAVAATSTAAAEGTATALAAPTDTPATGAPPESGIEPSNGGDVAGAGDENLGASGLPDTGTGDTGSGANSTIALLIAVMAIGGGASIFAAISRGKSTKRQ